MAALFPFSKNACFHQHEVHEEVYEYPKSQLRVLCYLRALLCCGYLFLDVPKLV